MIKKILTPIEVIPEKNINFIKYAARLSNIFGAKLILYNYYSQISAYYPTPEYANASFNGPIETFDEEKIKETQIEILLKKVPELANVEYDHVLQRGMPTDLISFEAEEEDVDLIVMDTDGATGIHQFIGTIAEKVTRSVECPVLVIPKEYEYVPIRKLSLAIDHNNQIEKKQLSLFLLLARAFNASVDIVHVHGEEEEVGTLQVNFLEELKKSLQKYKLEFTFRTILSNDIEKGITEFTERQKIDLLSLVYREHGFFERVFNPGLRKKITFHSDIPFLILK